MILDERGEKWACENCVKGHRVSSCQHRDRPLQHINKKGRPVSQCPHCRGLRKNRSTHIKCECGAQGHSKDSSIDKSSSGSNCGNCNCMNGMKCTCALKKEFTDYNGIAKFAPPTVSHRRTRSKPEVQARRSETAVQKARNNFHPPMPRQNNASQEFGHPYAIPRQVTDNRPYRHAQRSVDSLPLMTYATAQQLQPQESSQYLTLPANSYTSRVAKSEQASPFLGPQPSSPDFNSHMPHFDVSSPPHISFMHNAVSSHNPARYSVHDLSFFNNANDMETSSQYTAPSPSPFSTDNGPLNWADFDFNTFSDASGVAYSHPVPPSEGSVDFNLTEHPGLSRSSSGTVSDSVEGHYRQGSFSFGGSQNPTITVDSSWSTPNHFGDSNQDAYSNYSASVSSYAETPQDYMFPDNNGNTITFEAFQATGFGPGPEQIEGKDFAADFERADLGMSPTSNLNNMTMANFGNDQPWEQNQSPQSYGFSPYETLADDYQSHDNHLNWP